MKTIIPKKISKGATIGVVSPSAGLADLFPHRIEQAEKNLKRLGYNLKFAKNSLDRNGYVSATAKQRAADIHEMFLDSEVATIICTIGGDHANQVLKYLDFNIIQENPKVFIGYSDISVLHWAFFSKANLRTFYGPCLMAEMAEYPDIIPYTLEYFRKAVAQEKSIGKILPSNEWTAEVLDWSEKKDLERPRTMFKSDGYEWLVEGKASGEIIGGCVPSINHLAGTAYWIDPKGKIFFIDIPEGHEFEKGLSVDSLDSYLADLDNLKVFEKISGLIVGRPYNYTAQDEEDLKRVIKHYAGGYGYPILFNANIGHASPIITIPMGAGTNLDSSKNSFEIPEAGVM